MANAESNRSSAPPAQREGLFTRVITLPVKVLVWVAVALVFSIAEEWAGMALIWPEQGAGHARAMLEAEMGYLRADLGRSLISDDTAAFASRVADAFYYYGFEATGVAAGIARLDAPNAPNDGWVLRQSRAVYQPMAEYIVATILVTQTFALRLAVLTLATPVFVLAGVVGLIDGLVERDRRRFGGAREKGLVYHTSKRFVMPMLIGAWVVYLSLPISVHPNFVILPFAVLFALALGITAGTFKKYL